MRIHGTKGPKIQTIDESDYGKSLSIPKAEDTSDSDPLDAFLPETETEEKSTDPIAGYTFGDGTSSIDEIANSQGFEAWLKAFPPTWEELCIKYSKNIQDLFSNIDVITARYQKAQQDLEALKSTYEKSLKARGTTIAQAEVLSKRLALINESIARCKDEIQKMDGRASTQALQYVEELRQMKDLNGDNFIGDPSDPTSYGITTDEETGKTVYTQNGVVVANPLMDPDYEPKLTTGDGLTIIPKEGAATSPDVRKMNFDVFLKLQEKALTDPATGLIGGTINLGIPEYIWVKRKDSSTTSSSDPYEIQYTGGQASMVMAGWAADGGIHQDLPSDRSKYMQVKVTDMKILSQEAGTTKDGSKVYNTVIEFYNKSSTGDTLIGRFRIEGFTTTSDIPAACTMKDGTKLVAPSSVSLELNGDRRASAVVLDAANYASTCNSIVDSSVWGKLGLSAPGDGGNGDKAYQENIDVFSDPKDKYNHTAGGTKYRDAYCAEGKTSRVGNATIKGTNGLFVSGMRGYFNLGSKNNNITVLSGCNDLNDYARQHVPEGTEPIDNSSPLYSSAVVAEGGNNIMVANGVKSGGYNYLYGATLAWVVNPDSAGRNFIKMAEVSSSADKKNNPRCFAYARGGEQTFLYNPIEEDLVALGKKTDDRAVKQAHKKYISDDYYDITGACAATNPDDEDFSAGSDPGKTETGDVTFFNDAIKDIRGKILDELSKLPELDESEVPTVPVGPSTQELTDEVDSLFGEADEFLDDADPFAVEGETI